MRRVHAVLVALIAGCAGNTAPRPAPPMGTESMPELRIQQRAGAEEPTPAPVPLDLSREGRRVTLTAADADVRVLLPLLAEAAGVSLVLGPDARGSVSVHFEDVDAMAAIRQVLRQAGLTIISPLEPPDRPTVFYTVPVNVDALSAEEIQAHFGVSAEVARLIVESRPPRQW